MGSRVTFMGGMFTAARSFNADLSKWDVSSVTDMGGMFEDATSFNADLSKWDVSRVTNMGSMFEGASSFTGTLCGAWFTSTANKEGMFERSAGQICHNSNRYLLSNHKPQQFSPSSKRELESAIECLDISSTAEAATTEDAATIVSLIRTGTTPSGSRSHSHSHKNQAHSTSLSLSLSPRHRRVSCL